MIIDWVEQKVSPIMSKIAANIYLQSVKEGMISVMSLTIIGSFFLLLSYPPIPDAWYESMGAFRWIAAHRTAILVPFRATMSIISLFAIVGTASALAAKTKLHPVSVTILALISFFMTLNWSSAWKASAFKEVTATAENQGFLQLLLGLQEPPVAGTMFSITEGGPTMLGTVIPLDNMGSKGIFVGFLCVFIVVYIFRLFKDNNWTIKMPEGVPDGVSKTFEALLPLLAIVSLFGSLHLIPSLFPKVFPGGIIDLHTLLQKIFFWLPIIINTLPGAMIMILFIGLFWTAGIHGSSVVEAFTLPILLQLFDANANAYISGQPIPYILTNQFYYAFVWIGGGGATLSLTFLMAFFARSQYMKTLGKSSLVPSMVNINEPIIFGVPIVVNPYFFIPFILAPLVCLFVSYTAIRIGLVNPTVAAAPWTFPAPLYAYVATGGDWRAIILVLINIALTFGIYLPFFWAYDSKLLKEEQVGGTL